MPLIADDTERAGITWRASLRSTHSPESLARIKEPSRIVPDDRRALVGRERIFLEHRDVRARTEIRPIGSEHDPIDAECPPRRHEERAGFGRRVRDAADF